MDTLFFPPLTSRFYLPASHFPPLPNKLVNALIQIIGILRQHPEHPGPKDCNGDNNGKDLGYEGQSLLLYLGRRLKYADRQAHQQAKAQQRRRHVKRHQQRLLRNVDNRSLIHIHASPLPIVSAEHFIFL